MNDKVDEAGEILAATYATQAGRRIIIHYRILLIWLTLMVSNLGQSLRNLILREE